MSWQNQQQMLFQQLPAEVAWFVRLTLARLEQENLFDAPSVISRVLSEMRASRIAMIRSAVSQVEPVLMRMFAPRLRQRRIGA